MNRIGVNFNRAELNNLKKAELKEDLVKESKGKTLVEPATVKLADGKVVINNTDRGGIIAPPEHKDVNPNIVNDNSGITTETEEIYNNDGTKTVKTTKTDNEGRVLSEETKTYDILGKLTYTKVSTFEYDGNIKISQKDVESKFSYSDASQGHEGYTETKTTTIYENFPTKLNNENLLMTSQIVENFVDGELETTFEDIITFGDLSELNIGGGGWPTSFIRNEYLHGELICHFEEYYDENGHEVSSHEERISGDTKYITDKQYENGVLRKEIIDVSGYNNYRHEREYDENGVLRKESHVEKHQDSTWSWERTYDENGNLVRKKETVEDADGNITITTTTYNEDGSVKSTRTILYIDNDIEKK